jgi:hypothetical protein
VWSVCFVVLIVLPITAPFQTVRLVELLRGNTQRRVGVDANVSFVSSFQDTAFSTVPLLDGTEGRLKLESRSVNETWNGPHFRLVVLPHWCMPLAARGEQAVTILRL